MFIIAPLLRQAARQSGARVPLPGCVPVKVRKGSLQNARSFTQQAFQPSCVALERQSRLFSRSDVSQRRPPSSSFPHDRTNAPPASSPPPIQQHRRPEELYPESFAMQEKDLVNPSGRIYAVRRPPQEGEEDTGGNDGVSSGDTVDEARKPSILRPILFLGFSGAAIYYTAAYMSIKQTNETAERVIESSNRGGIFGDFSSFFGGSGVGSSDRQTKNPRRYEGVSEAKMRAAKKQELAERLGWRLNWMLGWCDQIGLPSDAKQFVGRVYTWGAESYLNLSDGRSCLLPVIAANTVVFLAWQVSRGRFMARHFLHVPASGRQYTHLTSTFSHAGLFHFATNNYVLWSFAAAAVLLAPSFYKGKDGKGKHTPEDSMTPHFLAFFATAGVFSSVVAHVLTALSYRFVALRVGAAAMARSKIGLRGSLGASGAVYSTVVATALATPDARIGIIFIPGFDLPIQDGVKLLVCLDFIGLFVPFSPLGHSAHLGGALFGYLYYYYGSQIWEACKAQIRRAEQQRVVTTASM